MDKRLKYTKKKDADCQTYLVFYGDAESGWQLLGEADRGGDRSWGVEPSSIKGPYFDGRFDSLKAAGGWLLKKWLRPEAEKNHQVDDSYISDKEVAEFDNRSGPYYGESEKKL